MDAVVMMYIWIAIICVAALIEAFTLQMVSIWFVAGGIVSLILYFCGVGYEVQIIVFIAVSIILLIALRKLCLKFLLKNTNEKTNVDALIGKEARLLKDIELGQLGEIKLGDVVWSTTTKDESPLASGTLVKITQVQGNKLIVEAVEQNKNEQIKQQEQISSNADETETVKEKEVKPAENKAQTDKQSSTKTKSKKQQKQD